MFLFLLVCVFIFISFKLNYNNLRWWWRPKWWRKMTGWGYAGATVFISLFFYSIFYFLLVVNYNYDERLWHNYNKRQYNYKKWRYNYNKRRYNYNNYGGGDNKYSDERWQTWVTITASAIFIRCSFTNFFELQLRPAVVTTNMAIKSTDWGYTCTMTATTVFFLVSLILSIY